MKLMRYASKANKPLFDMLDGLWSEHGFKLEPGNASDRPDIAVWQKSLGPTLKAEVSVTLQPTLPPDVWSLDPVVMIDSSYVAYWYNHLRLYRDFYTAMSSYEDSEYLQVLRYSPAHIRWQERLDLEVPTLEGRPETMGDLKAELSEVYERYIRPLLEQIDNPLALAEFQVRAETEFRTTRLRHEGPRYKVGNPYISTALLFDEAGETARAITFLTQIREKLSPVWEAAGAVVAQRALGQLDRLIDHLRRKMSKVEAVT